MTPDMASIIDELEAEIGRLVAELAVVRRDWQADVGTLIANLNTAEARVVRAKLEFLEALERAQTAENQRDAARAEVMALSAHMIAHNVELQTICESQKRSGECSNAGMCDSCPRQWMIDALRESNNDNE